MLLVYHLLLLLRSSVIFNDVLKSVLKQVRLLCEDLKDMSLKTNVCALAQILLSLFFISDRHTDAVKILINQMIIRDSIMRAQINLLINISC